ncbi:MAG TPA: hypothetical protein VII68_04100 [Casimicrobiaceae bacterium]|jgi:hypothetical protein
MNRPPILTILLAAALAGSTAVALAQQPAPKAATPKPSLDAEIERFTREAERLAEEHGRLAGKFARDADAYRWEMLAQGAEFDVDVDPDGPSFAFIAREFSSMREVVKNAPYQAEAVNEAVQTLADGNRIVRRSSAQVARDGYGRTRQERKGGTAYIFDPIENKSYALNPERKSAVRIPRAPSLIAPPAPPSTPTPVSALAPVPPVPPIPPIPPIPSIPPMAGVTPAPKATERVIVKRGEGKDEEVRIEVVRVGRDAHTHELTPMPPPISLAILPRGKGEQKPLGTREFDGVKADGTMTSYTIPAGQIGNEKAIVVTSERWFSPELHVVVYAKNSDPRTGDTIYRLANVKRGEPPADLFRIPADFKVRKP